MAAYLNCIAAVIQPGNQILVTPGMGRHRKHSGIESSHHRVISVMHDSRGLVVLTLADGSELTLAETDAVKVVAQ